MFRDEAMLNQARKLRRSMTIAERKLWSHIRRKQLDGNRFRRQVPVGSYIVDFACLQARVIIELDGVQHTEVATQQVDARRVAWLETRGYRVLRFTNVEVRTQTNRVLHAISLALALEQVPVGPPPTPRPPPAGEGAN